MKGHASEGALAPPLQQPQQTFAGAMVEMNATRMQRRNAAHLRQMPSCGETPSLCGGCRPVQWSWPAQLQSPPLYGKQGDTCAGEAIAGSLPSWQFLLLSHVLANHRIALLFTMLPSQSNHMAAARHHLLAYIIIIIASNPPHQCPPRCTAPEPLSPLVIPRPPPHARPGASAGRGRLKQCNMPLHLQASGVPAEGQHPLASQLRSGAALPGLRAALPHMPAHPPRRRQLSRSVQVDRNGPLGQRIAEAKEQWPADALPSALSNAHLGRQ